MAGAGDGVTRTDFFGSRQFVKRRTVVRRSVPSTGFGSLSVASAGSAECASLVEKQGMYTPDAVKSGVFDTVSCTKRRRSPLLVAGDMKSGWLSPDSANMSNYHTAAVFQKRTFPHVDGDWGRGSGGLPESGYSTKRQKLESEECDVLKVDSCLLTSACQFMSSVERDQSEAAVTALHWGQRGQRAHRIQTGKLAQPSDKTLPVHVKGLSPTPLVDSSRPCTPSIDEEASQNRMREESSSAVSGEADSDHFGSHDVPKVSGCWESRKERLSHQLWDLRRSFGSDKTQCLKALNIQLEWNEMADDFKQCGGRLRHKPKLLRPRKVQRVVQMMGLCQLLCNRKFTTEALLEKYEPQLPKEASNKGCGLRGLANFDESDDDV